MTTLTTRSKRTETSAAPARWLHLCNGLDPVRDGGMVPSILGMTGALKRAGGDVRIVTPTPSRLDELAAPEGLAIDGPDVDLDAAVRSADVVHMHGLWQFHSRRGAAVARSAKVPYVMAAHGMAEPWALRHKRWKKKLYLALVESRNLRRASCLHALSRPEIGHLRDLAPWTPVCFVPNGVDLAALDDLPPREALEAEHPELKDKFVLLFYGRVHAKKGLDLLADALGALARDFPQLHLLIAGKDDGALTPFSHRISELGLNDRATYVGHVSGAKSRRVWAAADAFTLPSYSEGFSMAILEALACSLPAVFTTACYFPEAAKADAAVVVEPEAEALTRALRELLERSPEERRTLGANGRRLVESEYTWEQQAAKLADVYRWLAGGGAPPECVIA
ncbi:glycosyltransferase [Planctomyces sp. SH-PL62]|uniref:glycosyltransferase n=1 Tax=Planctomyces sp. SH-PL62 TaxID=1636152 RepID=UPI00078EDD18|nr:glycosyltransferase [Planctomyces sp. SH-PL62]AMV35798.1 Mannosylfructose-phosphate synthase [Planctomyces sp. SH-PL62]